MHGSIHPMKTSAAALEWIEQTLADAFAGALSAIIGERVEVRRTAAPELPADPPPDWFLSEFDEFPGTGVLLGGGREVWLSIGRKLLADRGAVEANDEAALSAIREGIAKGVTTAVSALSGRFRRSIAIQPPRRLTPTPESLLPGTRTGLEVEFHDGTKGVLHLLVDPKLTAAVCAVEKDTVSGSPLNTKNLDLLLDVEMPVCVSFGRAQLPLKHLIKLTTGSIVELGRSVSEPVDIIVNSTVIARGEVVVVGGNFGVRIKEILSKQDRLRTLA